MEVEYHVKESIIEKLFELSKNIVHPMTHYKADPLEMAQDIILANSVNAEAMLDILIEIKTICFNGRRK